MTSPLHHQGIKVFVPVLRTIYNGMITRKCHVSMML